MANFFKKKNYKQKDIEILIENEYEENINLDFKRAEALDKSERVKTSIAKDVSSFANSDGGIIIYGIKEEKHIAKELSFIDGNIYNKEWLENVIQSRIKPRIDDLRIIPIRFDNKIDRTIYIVKIPISKDAPHQEVTKKIFYKRFNFSSVPMEEYEIRDLYNRLLPSKLKISPISVTESYVSMTENRIRKIRYVFGFKVKNIGNYIEKDYKLEIHLSELISDIYDSELYNHLADKKNGYYIFSVQGTDIIFQNETVNIITSKIAIDRSNVKKLIDSKIKLKLYFNSGLEEQEFSFFRLLPYGNKQLEESDFFN